MSLVVPPESTYTDVERNWIETEPGVLPMGQDSLWGQARKVFTDWMQSNLFDQLDNYWAAMSPDTCPLDELHNWEIELGIPVDETKPEAWRRALVKVRSYRGPWTTTIRKQIVETFILAVADTPLAFFTTGGIPFGSGGIPFGAGTFDVEAVYRITETIPDYTYTVQILDTIDIDLDGLYRELKRVTPAPIDDNFIVEQVADFMALYPSETLAPSEDLGPHA